VIPNPDFKVTKSNTSQIQGQSYYRTLLGNHTQSIDGTTFNDLE